MSKHFMVCISGFSGVGKDECASVLVNKFGAVQTGLADPAKRHMADTYGFSYDQLFGPSKFRNAGDLRYPKTLNLQLGLTPCTDEVLASPPAEKLRGKRLWSFDYSGLATHELESILSGLISTCEPGIGREPGKRTYYVEEGDPKFWLSPREALQLYCELMNNLYGNTWIDKGIRVHRQLAEIHQQGDGEVFRRHSYDRMKGVIQNNLRDGENWKEDPGYFVTCFADFRHWHEVRGAKAAGPGLTPVLIRILSERVPKPPYNHRSETEQATIPNSEFHYVLQNDGTVADAHAKVEHVMKEILNDGVPSTTRVL